MQSLMRFFLLANSASIHQIPPLWILKKVDPTASPNLDLKLQGSKELADKDRLIQTVCYSFFAPFCTCTSIHSKSIACKPFPACMSTFLQTHILHLMQTWLDCFHEASWRSHIHGELHYGRTWRAGFAGIASANELEWMQKSSHLRSSKSCLSWRICLSWMSPSCCWINLNPAKNRDSIAKYLPSRSPVDLDGFSRRTFASLEELDVWMHSSRWISKNPLHNLLIRRPDSWRNFFTKNGPVRQPKIQFGK